jgi:hypothetical protein
MEQGQIARNWRELIRPRGLEMDGDEAATYGRFACEPLERGFGVTLGNALRRVLLSSLQGAAITSLKIGNVLRRFASGCTGRAPRPCACTGRARGCSSRATWRRKTRRSTS